MSLISLIDDLKNDGYVVENEKFQNNDYSFSVYRAKKGKIFSKKLLLFDINNFQNTDFNKLTSKMKSINKKNDLCIAFCCSNENPDKLKTQTTYMADNGDGVCIIHFVYNNNDCDYIYDLDFNYYQSKVVKNAILKLIEQD